MADFLERIGRRGVDAVETHGRAGVRGARSGAKFLEEELKKALRPTERQGTLPPQAEDFLLREGRLPSAQEFQPMPKLSAPENTNLTPEVELFLIQNGRLPSAEEFAALPKLGR